MENKENKFKHLKEYIITLVIGLVIGGIIFCLYFFLNNATLPAACSATFLAGVILVCIGLLIMVTRFGAFDTFAYGFKQLGATFFTKNPIKYDDLVDYKQQKNTQRKKKSNYYFIIILSGIIYCLAGGILEIIFHNIYHG